MSQVQHFNIIQYYASFLEHDTLVIVMEYAAGGDLAQKIRSHKE
jgi:serine/threonine protein kinase